MTGRVLVTAGIVVLLAVGTVSFVLGRHSVVPSKPIVATAPPPQLAPAPPTAVSKKEEAAPLPAPAPAPVVSPTPSVDLAALAAADPAKFVAGLSDRANRELDDLLLWRSSEAWRKKDQRYQLTTDVNLTFLYSKDPALVLTVPQQTRIKQLKETFKPQIDAQLADVWAKQDDLSRRTWDFNKNASSSIDPARYKEQNAALMQEQINLQEQARSLTQQVNTQYEAAVKAVLSPAQRAAYDEITVGNVPLSK